jgi:hypothetical protein
VSGWRILHNLSAQSRNSQFLFLSHFICDNEYRTRAILSMHVLLAFVSFSFQT